MKRTIAAVAVLLIVASVGIGYVVGRSGGGGTGDSISSRLGGLQPPSFGSGTPIGESQVFLTDPTNSAVRTTPFISATVSAAGIPATPVRAVVETPLTVATPWAASPATPIAPAPSSFSTLEPTTPVAVASTTRDRGVAIPAGASVVLERTLAAPTLSRQLAGDRAIPPTRPVTVGGDGIPIDFRTPAP